MTIEEMRKKKGLGLKNASEKIGITKTYLYLIEKKQRIPSDKVRTKMAKVYGVSPTTIFLATQLTQS